MGKATGDLYIKGICGIIFSEIYVEDCRKYDPSTVTVNNTQNKLKNVADFGVYDTSNMYYSAIISINNIQSNVGGICVVNNVQTSAVSPYPSGYCDYRLSIDTVQRGLLGGGCGSSSDYGIHTTSGKLSNNTEYLMEMIFNNGSLTGKITKVSDNTVVFNETITPPRDYSNYHFALFLFSTVTVTYRNVKIKVL